MTLADRRPTRQIASGADGTAAVSASHKPMNVPTPNIGTSPADAIHARPTSRPLADSANSGIASAGSPPIHPPPDGHAPVGLTRLPKELLGHITHIVQSEGPFASHALFQTCLTISEIQDIPAVRTIQDLQIRIVKAAESCVRDIRSSPFIDVGACAPLLGLVRKSVRKEIVGEAIALADDTDKAEAIGQLASNLKPLDASDRSQLLSAATAITDEDDRAIVIEGLRDQLGHLNSIDRVQLFRSVDSIEDEAIRGECIGFLGKGLVNFDDATREGLIKTALNDLSFPLARRFAISGLIDGLACLEDEQRSRLVTAALDIEDDGNRSVAIHSLGAALEHLSLSQRRSIVDAALLLEETSRPYAIAGMGAGLQYLSEEQCIQLVNAAFAFTSNWAAASAIAGLTTGMAHVADLQRTRMLEAVLTTEDRSDRDAFLALTASSVAYLDDPQRERLVATIIALAPQNHEESDAAVRKMARQLALLSPSQRQRLFTTCLTIPDPAQRSSAIVSLAPGLMHLEPAQRDSLIEEVEQMPLLPDRADALEGLMRATQAAAAALHNRS